MKIRCKSIGEIVNKTHSSEAKTNMKFHEEFSIYYDECVILDKTENFILNRIFLVKIREV